MSKLLGEARRFSKYGIIGLANNAALYLLFLLLLTLGFSPVLTAGICYVLGVAISYLLNRRWTFASTNSHTRDLPKFILSYGVGLASTLLTIYVLMIWLPPEIAQILNILITALVIYGMLRLLRFGTKWGDHVHD